MDKRWLEPKEGECVPLIRLAGLQHVLILGFHEEGRLTLLRSPKAIHGLPLCEGNRPEEGTRSGNGWTTQSEALVASSPWVFLAPEK